MGREPQRRRSGAGKHVNHFPNRDYDVVLDHSRIAMEIERGKNLENDVLLTIMTPEGGPKHMDPSGYECACS